MEGNTRVEYADNTLLFSFFYSRILVSMFDFLQKPYTFKAHIPYFTTIKDLLQY